MRAEIITTGTELLLGEIVDTNGSFIAGELARLGIDLYYMGVVGDNRERLLGALRQAHERSDIIILTGGLGPTQGDLTREMIAALLGEKLEVSAELQQDLTDYFGRIAMGMPENNIKQATLIPSAAALRNPQGTAPGWWVEKDGKTIVALPGPPGEMQAMWQREVLPRLEKKAGAIITYRTLKVLGLSESRVDELLSSFLGAANPTLATYAKPDGIHVRIAAKAARGEAAAKMISQREQDVRRVLEDSIWGTDDETLEGVVADMLRRRNLTVAVAESFTGGFLSYTLAGAPESTAFFKGALIASAADACRLLNDSTTAVTPGPETAAAMARAARSRFSADIGVGLDGAPDTDGSLKAGTAFIAVYQANSGQISSQTYRGRPHQLVRRATCLALFNLRKALQST